MFGWGLDLVIEFGSGVKVVDGWFLYWLRSGKFRGVWFGDSRRLLATIISWGARKV